MNNIQYSFILTGFIFGILSIILQLMSTGIHIAKKDGNKLIVQILTLFVAGTLLIWSIFSLVTSDPTVHCMNNIQFSYILVNLILSIISGIIILLCAGMYMSKGKTAEFIAHMILTMILGIDGLWAMAALLTH